MGRGLRLSHLHPKTGDKCVVSTSIANIPRTGRTYLSANHPKPHKTNNCQLYLPMPISWTALLTSIDFTASKNRSAEHVLAYSSRQPLDANRGKAEGLQTDARNPTSSHRRLSAPPS